MTFPSSHCSVPALKPSPHTVTQVVGLAVVLPLYPSGQLTATVYGEEATYST